jgi:hypothetical protein
MGFRSALLCTLILVAGATEVFAAKEFTASLRGDLAVPPTPSPATGTALFILNHAETDIEYWVEFSGLVGTELAAHVHDGPPDAIGAIVFNLGTGNPKQGTWQFVLPSVVADLKAGRLSVNIHTSVYTSGEIRGILTSSDVPVENTTWGRVKSLFNLR